MKAMLSGSSATLIELQNARYKALEASLLPKASWYAWKWYVLSMRKDKMNDEIDQLLFRVKLAEREANE